MSFTFPVTFENTFDNTFKNHVLLRRIPPFTGVGVSFGGDSIVTLNGVRAFWN